MLWFGPKKYKFVIRNKELTEGVRSNGFSFLLDFHHQHQYNPQSGVNEHFYEFYGRMIKEGALNSQFLDNYQKISTLKSDYLSIGLLYRGINPKEYKLYLKYGNTKQDSNISTTERARLQKLGLKPEEVMYAWVGEYKAWEFAGKYNPSIVIIYDPTFFEKIDSETFLYKIKPGFRFKDAVKAYIIVWYL